MNCRFPQRANTNCSPLLPLLIAALCAAWPWVLWFERPALAADQATIEEGATVTFSYRFTVPGTVPTIYSDVGTFVQGQHQILPVVERELAGLHPGDEKSVEVTPEEGFGQYDEQKKENVPRTSLPDGVKEGDVVKDQTGRVATIATISDKDAVMDYNHPLAGKRFVMQIKVLKVEKRS
ncbi:MAG: peptidylprolyl isomerase [Nitrospiraceae bacterium]